MIKSTVTPQQCIRKMSPLNWNKFGEVIASAAGLSVIKGEGKKQQGGEERRRETPAIRRWLNGEILACNYANYPHYYCKAEIELCQKQSDNDGLWQQSRGWNFSKSVILKLFHQSLFCWAEQYLRHTIMFYFNVDNTAAWKLQDQRSASSSLILGVQ